MSEVVPQQCPWPDNETFERRFELIKNSFELDTDGPLFSAIWDFEIDVEELRARRYPTDSEKRALKIGDASSNKYFKPVITTGELLLNELFIQIEFMQPPERLKEFEAGRDCLMLTKEQGFSESDQFLFNSLDRLVRVHKATKGLFSAARDTYNGEEFWEDVTRRKGLKTDRLEELYMWTEPYENQGLLGALNQVGASGAFAQDIVFEANRIARIMVARETGMIE